MGGILFALIGMQYLGAGLRDGRMPRPGATAAGAGAAPQTQGAAQQQVQQVRVQQQAQQVRAGST